MSYILDALRKAEHDRNVGDSPKLDFSPLSESTQKRAWGLWLLIGGLGVCVGVLGAMQLSQYLGEQRVASRTAAAAPPAAPRQPAETPPAKEAPPAAEPPAPAEPPPPAPTRRSVQVNTPGGPVEIEMPLEPDTKLAPVTPPPEVKPPPPPTPAPRSQAQSPAPPKSAEPSVSRPAKPEPAPPKPESLSLPSPAELAAEMEGEAPAPQDLPPPTYAPEPESAPVAEPEPPREEPLVSYLGLPPDIRNDIGELAMNAHVYSSTPGRGFVIINGRRYRPGDKLQEGPVLDEIRQEGAVMQYRGRRFLLPVPR